MNGQQKLYLWPGAVAVLIGASLLSGCQAGPVVPFGFGPQLDNLFGVLMLVALGALLCRLFAPRLRGAAKNTAPGAAESIARERYARGEITQEQYNEILRTLAAR